MRASPDEGIRYLRERRCNVEHPLFRFYLDGIEEYWQCDPDFNWEELVSELIHNEPSSRHAKP